MIPPPRGPPTPLRQRAANANDPQGVLLSVLFYSILMITMPISMYFLTNFVIEKMYHSKDGYVYAAAVAVITVHIILGLFVYKAYKESDEPTPMKID